MAINTDTPRPLFPIALAFISGIAVFDSLRLPTGWLLSVTALVVLFLAITLIVKSLRHSVLSDILLIGLCFLAGAVRLLVAQQVPANHLANFPHDDVPIYLEGVVTDEPVYYQPKNEFLAGGRSELAGSFIINAETISWDGQSDSVCGKVRVGFYGLESAGDLSMVKYGNRLQLLGVIYSPRSPTNPGEFDYAGFLERQGIYKTIRIKSPANIKLLDTGQGSMLWAELTRLRNSLAGEIDRVYGESDNEIAPPAGEARPNGGASSRTRLPAGRHGNDRGKEVAGLLKALILGERPAVPDTIESKFMRTGTIHYLSVSGLHLAMLVGFFFLILGGLGVTGRPRAVILIISALLYALLTGLSTPVTRSLVMITVYLGSEIFIRKSNPFNSLALAGLIITAYNPNEVFSVGFQLSFLSVMAIVSFTLPTLYFLTYKNIGNEIPVFVPLTLRERLDVIIRKYLFNAVSVSVAATLGVFPLVLMYFHLITPVSIITNIVLSPLIFLVMVIGFINLPLMALGIYSWLVPLVSFLVNTVVWLVDLFSRIPWAYFYLPDIPRAFLWIFYGLFLLWMIRHRLHSLFSQSVITSGGNYSSVIARDEVPKQSQNLSVSEQGLPRSLRSLAMTFVNKVFRNDIFFGGALIAMLLWFIIWVLSVGMPAKNDGLTLTMLDVRQGASFVIQTPEGRTILYDCGTFGSRDVGEQVVSPFLWNKGITKIDTLILSHAHLDHINGVPSILARFPVKRFLSSAYFLGSYWGEKMEGEIDSYNIPGYGIGQGDIIALDVMVTAEVLSPVKPMIVTNPSSVVADTNDLSLVLKIRYGNKSILLCGDIQAEGIKNLLSSGKDISADILQIPHHGFSIKSGQGQDRNYLEELINRVNPSEIVINTDGDEIDESILEICRARDIIIHSSDQDGCVEINLH